VAEPEWLASLIILFEDPKVIAAGGQAILNWVKARPTWFPEDLDWVVGGSFIGLPLYRRAVVQNPHLQRLLQQARVNWGDDHAQELQSTLENTSRQLSEVSSNLPGKGTEPGFYQ
jgi:hypothetical protein